MKKNLSLFFFFFLSLQLSAQTTTTVQQVLQGVSLPQVAVNLSGDTAVVWNQASQTLGFPMIFAATKVGQQTSFTTLQVSTTTVSNQVVQFASNAHVIIDSNGNAVAIWQQNNLSLASNTVIYGAVKMKSDTGWRTPVAISRTANQNGNVSETLTSVRTPQLYIDASGNAIALWAQFNTATNCFMAFTSTLSAPNFAATTWTTPVELSSTRFNSTTQNLFDVSNPQMAIDSKGDQVFVWSQVNNRNGAAMIFALSKAGGANVFQPLVQLSSTLLSTVTVPQTLQEATSPQVAIDGSGHAVVAWTQFNQSLGLNMIFVSFQLANGTWTTPLQLSLSNFSVVNPHQPLLSASNPKVVVDTNGNAVVMWQQSNLQFNNDSVLYSASRPAGSLVWRSPIPVSTRILNNQLLGNLGDGQITMDGASTTTAVWSQFNAKTNCFMIFEEKLFQNATAWSSATLFQISRTTSGNILFNNAIAPQITVNGSGLVTVVWAQTNTNFQFAQTFLQYNPGPTSNTSPQILSKTSAPITNTIP